MHVHSLSALSSPFAAAAAFSLARLPRSIVSTFSFYFYMLCSHVIRSGEASCQLNAARQKSLQTTSHHMSLPRSLSFSRFITLFSFPSIVHALTSLLCIILEQDKHFAVHLNALIIKQYMDINYSAVV